MALYGLTEKDRATLQELIAAFRRGELGRPRPIRRELLDSQKIYIVYSGSTGIAARSGANPGSASVTFYKISSTGGLATASVTETAYNLSSAAVAANTYLQAKREALSGKLLIDFEDCS